MSFLILLITFILILTQSSVTKYLKNQGKILNLLLRIDFISVEGKYVSSLSYQYCMQTIFLTQTREQSIAELQFYL